MENQVRTIGILPKITDFRDVPLHLDEIRNGLLAMTREKEIDSWFKSFLTIPSNSHIRGASVRERLNLIIGNGNTENGKRTKKAICKSINSLFSSTGFEPEEVEKENDINFRNGLLEAIGHLKIRSNNDKIRDLCQSETLKFALIPGSTWKDLHYSALCILVGDSDPETEKIFQRDIQQKPYRMVSFLGLGMLDPKNISIYIKDLKRGLEEMGKGRGEYNRIAKEVIEMIEEYHKRKT